MEGYYSPGIIDPRHGHRKGSARATFLKGDFEITIAHLDRFIEEPDQEAHLNGTLSAAALGEDLALQNGRFNLLVASPPSGKRMIYRGVFDAAGQRYSFQGHKEIDDDPLVPDAVQDMALLLVAIRSGGENGPVFGAGTMRFHDRDFPGLLRSIQTPGANRTQRVQMISKFFRFAFGEVADTYLQGIIEVESVLPSRGASDAR